MISAALRAQQQSRPKTFYDTLTAAVADFSFNGYDSERRLEDWLRELRLAALRDMIPQAQAEHDIKESLKDIYQRLVERGGLMERNPSAGRFTIDRVKPQLRAELDRRILASAGLIKLNRERAVAETLQRFSGWATSIPVGGSDVVDKREVKRHVGKRLQSMSYIDRRLNIDQGTKFASNLSDIFATAGGAIAAEWHQHHTNHPRKVHTLRDGKIYLIRNSWAHERSLVKTGHEGYTDEITQPGEEVFCLIGQTRIPFAQGVEVAYRRWYDGKLATIITSSGKKLSATLNHPILTPKGWIPIGLLKNGDYVIEISDESVFSTSESNNYDAVPIISEVFSACEEFGVYGILRGNRLQFHGDGAEGDVDVVRTARPLHFGRVTGGIQLIKNFFFTKSNDARFSQSTIGQLFYGALGTASCVVSRLCDFFTVFNRHVGHALEHLFATDMPHCLVSVGGNFFSFFQSATDIAHISRFRQCSNRYSGITQPGYNNTVRYAERVRYFYRAFAALIPRYNFVNINNVSLSSTSICQRLFGQHPRFTIPVIESTVRNAEEFGYFNEFFPFKTKTESIVKINFRSFSGHVYNLQTQSGWFVSEGIITHNCRCTYKYIYGISQLPYGMVTEKGRAELARVRAIIEGKRAA